MSRIVTKLAIGNDIVLGEEEVGQAPHRICFPGVSSCIAITAVSHGFLCGVHLTVSTEPEKVDIALGILAKASTGGLTAIFVVGKIAEFKIRTVDKRLNTRKKMSKLLRETLAFKGSTVEFCDTAQFGPGSNISVTKAMAGVQFCWQSDKIKVNYFTIPSDLNNYTPFPANSFMRR